MSQNLVSGENYAGDYKFVPLSFVSFFMMSCIVVVGRPLLLYINIFNR